MCEHKGCKQRSRFFCHIRVTPQPLGPDGVYGMESKDAGRSQLTCTAHLPRTVRELYALDIALSDAVVHVRPYDARTEKLS